MGKTAIEETPTTTEIVNVEVNITSPVEEAVESGLIREMFYESKLVEDEGSDLPKIVAKVQEADTVNRNGRVYPKAVLEREVGKMQDEIRRRPGTVDHPEGYGASIDRLGIIWTKVWMDDNEVWAEGNIIPTTAGKNLEAAIKAGVEVGISSRGYGSAKVGKVNNQEVLIIQSDYELFTFDAVTDPSVYSARITKIESIERSALADPAFAEIIAEKVAAALQEKAMKEKAVEATEEVKETEEVEESTETSPVETPAEENTETEAVEESQEETTEEESTEQTEETEEVEDTSAEELAAANEKIGTLETSVASLEETIKGLKEATEDAVNAIASIVNLIGDELGDQDFYDVASLAYMCASLKSRYLGNDDMDGFENFDGKKDATLKDFVDAVTGIVRQVSEKSVSDYIDSVVKSEKYADRLADFLKENCSSKKEVDENLTLAKKLVAKFETTEPAGKGTTSDPVAKKPELTLAEQYAVAGRVSVRSQQS